VYTVTPLQGLINPHFKILAAVNYSASYNILDTHQRTLSVKQQKVFIKYQKC